MKVKRVTRYIAECGKGFWNITACAHHEHICKCWKNPKHKTCKTCRYDNRVGDADGVVKNKCTNPRFEYDKHFKPAHKKAPDLCINCAVWKPKEAAHD